VNGETPPATPTGFWEQRTGWTALKRLLFLEPLPGGARWAAAFGSLLLFAFGVQVVTGILLAMNYAPSENSAWASVNYIQHDATLGGFIRAVHHWGSSAMVVLLLVHLVQVFVWGAYKPPREFTWMVGVLLLFCTLGMAFTGYLLPWDQKAYWATKVGLGIAGTVPFIGDGLRNLLQGGDQIGNLTLTRFFTLHGFILPGLMIGLVVVHLYLFRRNGVTPPWWRTAEQLRAEAEPFWPKQVLKDGVLALVFLLGLGVWAYFRPAPLEEQANPAKLYEARPEWYFMFLFQLLSYFKGPYEVVGTFVLPCLFFLVLFFWPFLDRSPHRNPARRPVAIGLLTVSTAALIGLTIFAVVNDVRMEQPAQAVAKEPPPREAPGAIQQLQVVKLYATHCQACHGVDGSGKQIRAAMPTVPDFTSLAWQIGRRDVEITHRIMDGNGPLMPAFRDKLTKEENLGLAVYVRAFSIEFSKPATAGPGKEPPPLPIAPTQLTGEQLYRAYLCMSCHDVDGKGGVVKSVMQEIPNFTDDKFQKDHTDADLARSIIEGKGKFMPKMKDPPAKEDVDKLVAFVRSFKEGKLIVKEEPKEPPSPPDAPKVEPHPPAVSPMEPGLSAEERAAKIRAASVFYREYCINCHGKDGRGVELKASMPHIPDFTSKTWQESRTNNDLVNTIEMGGKVMPPFARDSFGRERFKDHQLQDLVAYIRAFGPAGAGPPEPAKPDDFEEQYRRLLLEWDALQKQLDELSKKPKPP
jgi:quinol-cytochrome oxidoreductase complex cytochrome b subunit/mono/diheme cytochrome c family protein